jgi:hypothetical protein
MTTAKLHLPRSAPPLSRALTGFSLHGAVRRGLGHLVGRLAERRMRAELDRLDRFHLTDIGMERIEGFERWDELGHRPRRHGPDCEYRRRLSDGD